MEKAKELHGEEMAKVMDELNGSNSKNMMLTDRCNSLEEEVKGLKEEVMEMERVGKVRRGKERGLERRDSESLPA